MMRALLASVVVGCLVVGAFACSSSKHPFAETSEVGDGGDGTDAS